MIIDYRLDMDAIKPTKAYSTDAGFDLYTPDFVIVPAGKAVSIDTGVHMLIPEGFCGLLVSKSGLNVKNGLQTTGLIDAGYTGSIWVKVYNYSECDYAFNAGDKISQIVILPVPQVLLHESKFFDYTARGDNGFGSSGR